MADDLFRDTHADLVLRAKGWLRRQGCKTVFGELTCVTYTGEIPDSIGWHGGLNATVLIECKTSRSDFLADRKKRFRQEPHNGMGSFRYFMCPPGVIRAEDLPERWGLLYCHGRSVRMEAGRELGRYIEGDDPWRFPAKNDRGEVSMLLSVMNRISLTIGQAEFDKMAHMSFEKREAQRLAKYLASRQGDDEPVDAPFRLGMPGSDASTLG